MSADDDQVAVDGHPLYFASTLRWPTPVIPVCWDTPGFAAEKGWVRAIVEGQYEGRPGFFLDFTGWGECPDGPPPDGISLSIGDEWPSTLGLGTQIRGVPKGVRLNFTFASIAKDFDTCVKHANDPDSPRRNRICIESIGLHEMGHALGLAHEQNRPDTPATCTEKPQGGNGDITVGAWDVNSVMNYCNPDVAMELSPTDLDGLSIAYGSWSISDSRFGDFDGDGKVDRLDREPDQMPTVVHFTRGGGVQLSDSRWCSHSSAELLVGDYDGDGKDDLACHDAFSGYAWVNFAANGLGATDWQRSMGFCSHSAGRFGVGDFDGDRKADFFCHDVSSGQLWVALSRGDRFESADWWQDAHFCIGPDSQVKIGDVNGDGRADLICKNGARGVQGIALAQAGRFAPSSTAVDGFCSGASGQLEVVDLDGDRRADLLCHDTAAGTHRAALARGGGNLELSDWSLAVSPFCSHYSTRFSAMDLTADRKAELVCDDGRRLHWVLPTGL